MLFKDVMIGEWFRCDESNVRYMKIKPIFVNEDFNHHFILAVDNDGEHYTSKHIHDDTGVELWSPQENQYSKLIVSNW